VVRLNEIASGDQFGADDCLYIMFTSGSTGIPKGVPISESNAGHYVDEMLGAFDFDSTDRFLQSVELTFDLSVHDMLLCWSSGAALFAVPEAGAPMAPRFIKQLGITRSLSVPSAAAQAKAVGLVRPGGMPTLKTSFFCGEALPTSLVKSWAEAAPNSDIINIYGPTEATIAFSMFDCKAGGANDLSIAPIGKPIGRQEMRVDTNGELLLSGEQVFAGYLNDSERSARVLTDIDGRRWYRTGDLAEYDPLYGYIFKGRMDSQIKLRGYRVELGEVEGALRKASGTDLVAVLPVKEVGPGAYNDLLGVVAGSGLSTEEIRGSLTSLLPVYMVPSRIEALQAMPKNTNDKVDYIALASLFSKDLAGR
jgi:non-ribosomal peptide synthetase component F